MEWDSGKSGTVTGTFVTLGDERFYAIGNADKMPPFFMSLVSNSDHWLFVSSNGGLTAGRVSPEHALFPYVTVDKVYDSAQVTGCKTLVRVKTADGDRLWEPFNFEHNRLYATRRNLYKSVLGNKLLFEEINDDLGLTYRYCWKFSEAFGFVRDVEITNTGAAACSVEIVDGLQNILPAGTPRFTQTNSSNLVDAYKWSELDEQTSLALFTLFSGITDRAEPCESLTATTVFCTGLEAHRVLLSTDQLDAFRRGERLTQEGLKRGVRGAYLVNAATELQAGASWRWRQVANVEQTQVEAVKLLERLQQPDTVDSVIDESVTQGSDELARIMAAADAFQHTAEENVSAHHYANVLFNVLRGGIVADQYQVARRDFSAHLKLFNAGVWNKHQAFIDQLPAHLDHARLLAAVREQGDAHLERLAHEFLPVTFGRRHGDPSRPWNQFAIRLTDESGERLLTYQGNWRDIFQNWEALLFSFPEYIESIIAKFVNASTIDGYNPYRITNEGFDWEVEEPDDPWSYIGYWGDHQIIYLLKLLELSSQFHPARLGELLHRPVFSYANVPYRIKPFEAILANAKSTVEYDVDLAQRIEERVAATGADGKLLQDEHGAVYQVTLLEKLLVPLLSKLGNLVVDGGIWMNTQRPEWNDANNALVGQGLSMVTLYYLRRYIKFMQELLARQSGAVTLSAEVSTWLGETAAALHDVHEYFGNQPLSARDRQRLLVALGEAASRYRGQVYTQEAFTGTVQLDLAKITRLLSAALAAIDQSIATNRREDGLYHAYNLLELEDQAVEVDNLYLMLEGQVGVLSSGAVEPTHAIALLQAMFASDLYRTDQDSFLLYPDRKLPRFLEKNCIPDSRVDALGLLGEMLERQDGRIVQRDVAGTVRFNAELSNVDELNARLDALIPTYGEKVEAARQPLQELYDEVFNHKAFTGRSGGMFGFEGLGSIYWHMVAKLLLAVQENYFAAIANGADDDICRELGSLYYRVREGIGFNKTPSSYGAFPTDPYSHTPGHMGAQQPGMTGQVKEEILARFGELGVRVDEGVVHFAPSLLRACEFSAAPQSFRYLDVDNQWQELAVPAHALAFTWCQIPIIYALTTDEETGVTVVLDDGGQQTLSQLSLPADMSEALFCRSGRLRRIEFSMTRDALFDALPSSP